MKTLKSVLSAAACVSCVGLIACGGGGSSSLSTHRESTATSPRTSASDEGNPAAILPAERPSGPVVLRIGDQSFTRSDVRGWMAAGESRQEVPVPPEYTACVKHQAKLPSKSGKHAASLSSSELKAQCATRYEDLKQQALQSIISSEWIVGEASDSGLPISESEVEHQLAQTVKSQFKSQAEFRRYLKKSGQTVKQLLLSIKAEIASTRILARLNSEATTSAALAKYYEENKLRFRVPERRDIELFRGKTPAIARQVMAKVKAGRDFSTIAKPISLYEEGSPLEDRTPGVLISAASNSVDKAIFAAKVGAFQGPFKVDGLYLVFKLKKITPRDQKSLAEVESLLKPRLVSGSRQATINRRTAMGE